MAGIGFCRFDCTTLRPAAINSSPRLFLIRPLLRTSRLKAKEPCIQFRSTGRSGLRVERNWPVLRVGVDLFGLFCAPNSDGIVRTSCCQTPAFGTDGHDL